MALDQEHLARVALDRAVEAIGDHLQLRRLIGRNLPRSGFEVDGVEIDARHQLPHRRAVTDLVERVAAVDPVYRRCQQGVVDQFRRRYVGLDDVAIVGNADDRRRQVDIEAADRARIAIAIVDDDDLAAFAVASEPPQQLAVAADNGDDLRAVGTNHDRAGFAAHLLGLDVARAKAEAILFVVANERLAGGVDHDHPAGFGEDPAAALVAFLPLAAEIFHATRPLWRGALRSGCQGLGGRRRWWKWCGDSWWRTACQRGSTRGRCALLPAGCGWRRNSVRRRRSTRRWLPAGPSRRRRAGAATRGRRGRGLGLRSGGRRRCLAGRGSRFFTLSQLLFWLPCGRRRRRGLDLRGGGRRRCLAGRWPRFFTLSQLLFWLPCRRRRGRGLSLQTSGRWRCLARRGRRPLSFAQLLLL